MIKMTEQQQWTFKKHQNTKTVEKLNWGKTTKTIKPNRSSRFDYTIYSEIYVLAPILKSLNVCILE